MWLFFGGLFTGFFIIEVLVYLKCPMGEIRLIDLSTMGSCAVANIVYHLMAKNVKEGD